MFTVWNWIPNVAQGPALTPNTVEWGFRMDLLGCVRAGAWRLTLLSPNGWGQESRAKGHTAREEDTDTSKEEGWCLWVLTDVELLWDCDVDWLSLLESAVHFTVI